MSGRPLAPCTPDATGTCAVCADEGLAGTIVALRDARTAVVDFGAARVEVAIDLLDGPLVGDRVLVHLGFALAFVRSDG